MRAKIISVMIAIVSVVMFSKFIQGSSASIPDAMQTVSGAVVSTDVIYGNSDMTGKNKRARSTSKDLEFIIAGSDLKFRYPSNYPNINGLIALMKVGDDVEVKYIIDDSTPKLWALNLNSKSIVTPENVLKVKHKGGIVLLIMSLIFGAISIYIWRS
jgi:hypothetical protein